MVQSASHLEMERCTVWIRLVVILPLFVSACATARAEKSLNTETLYRHCYRSYDGSGGMVCDMIDPKIIGM